MCARLNLKVSNVATAQVGMEILVKMKAERQIYSEEFKGQC